MIPQVIYDFHCSFSFFVFKGCDVNGDLMNGRKPIHFAADYGQHEVIGYLVSQGANVNVRLFIHLKNAVKNVSFTT